LTKRVLQGKRILITGAGGGIGRALAISAIKHGMHVTLSDVATDRLEQTRTALLAFDKNVKGITADLTTEGDRQRAIHEIETAWGGLDVLVNAAGAGAFGSFLDLDPDSLRRIMEINFFSVAELCRIAIPVLRRGQDPLIVNVSSMYGRRGVPQWAGYCASKFALCGFSEALRAELVPDGIGLLLVLPGVTKTDFGSRLIANSTNEPLVLSVGLNPDVVAKSVFESVIERKNELIVGADARRMLLANRFFPRWVDRRKGRQVMLGARR
jgi:short-subunit dehydrogenase